MNDITIFLGEEGETALLEGSIVRCLSRGVFLVDISRGATFGSSYGEPLDSPVEPELALVIL